MIPKLQMEDCWHSTYGNFYKYDQALFWILGGTWGRGYVCGGRRGVETGVCMCVGVSVCVWVCVCVCVDVGVWVGEKAYNVGGGG